MSSNSKFFKEENLEILNFLIEESCPSNNIKIIDLPLVGEESLKKEKVLNDYKNLLIKFEKKIIYIYRNIFLKFKITKII